MPLAAAMEALRGAALVRWQVDSLVSWVQPTELADSRRAAALGHAAAVIRSHARASDMRALPVGCVAPSPSAAGAASGFGEQGI